MPLAAILGLISLAALAAAFVWLLRGAEIWGGRPAAAIVAGLLAGVLLGPAGLGSLAPGQYDAIFRGGAMERHELDRLLSRQQADRAALVAAGGDAAGLQELFTRHADERRPLETRLAAAVSRHRQNLGIVLGVLLGLGFLLGAWAGRAAAPSSPALLMASLAVFLELALMVVLLRWIAGTSMELALGVGAAGAAGTVFIGLPMRWVPAAGRSRLVRGTGPAMVLLAGVAVMIAAPAGAGRAVAAGVIGAAGVGWMLRRVGLQPVRLAVWSRDFVLWVVVPTATAAAAASVDWRLIGADVWALVVLVSVALLSGNGAFLGLMAGARTARGDGALTPGGNNGRRRPHDVVHQQSDDLLAGEASPLPTALPEMLLGWQPTGFGPTQACFAALLLASGIVDPDNAIAAAALAAVILSAAVGETTLGGMMQLMVRRETAE